MPLARSTDEQPSTAERSASRTSGTNPMVELTLKLKLSYKQAERLAVYLLTLFLS